MSFRLQRLEMDVGFAVAGLAFWIAVAYHPPGFGVQMLALMAAGLASWSNTFPARTPAVMFGRAMVLVLGGSLLLMAPGAGGPLGPGLMWLLATALGYALLLPLRWGGPAGLIAFSGYVAACFFAEPLPPWRDAVVYGGAFWILTVLFLMMGRSLRASELRAEQSRTDQRSSLYNQDGFFVNGGELFETARRNGEPFSLALLQATDLRDASEVLGRKAADALFKQTVKAITAATPARGIAARTDTVEFAMALPGLSVAKAEAMLHQALGDPPQVNLRLGDANASIVLQVAVAQAPAELHTLEDLYDRLHLRLRDQNRASATPSETAPHGTSTLQGLLMADPVIPRGDKPTLPMPLAQGNGGPRRAAR